MDVTEIRAMKYDLDEGQSWDDPIAIRLTRQQWVAVMAGTMAQVESLAEGIDNAITRAKRGDLVATLIVDRLIDTHQAMVDGLAGILRDVKPDVYAEFQRERAEAEAMREAVHAEAVRNADA